MYRSLFICVPFAAWVCTKVKEVPAHLSRWGKSGKPSSAVQPLQSLNKEWAVCLGCFSPVKHKKKLPKLKKRVGLGWAGRVCARESCCACKSNTLEDHCYKHHGFFLQSQRWGNKSCLSESQKEKVLWKNARQSRCRVISLTVCPLGVLHLWEVTSGSVTTCGYRFLEKTLAKLGMAGIKVGCNPGRGLREQTEFSSPPFSPEKLKPGPWFKNLQLSPSCQQHRNNNLWLPGFSKNKMKCY